MMVFRHRRNRTRYKNARHEPGIFVSSQDQMAKRAIREQNILQLIASLVTNLFSVVKTRHMNMASLRWRPCLVIDMNRQ